MCMWVHALTSLRHHHVVCVITVRGADIIRLKQYLGACTLHKRIEKNEKQSHHRGVCASLDLLRSTWRNKGVSARDKAGFVAGAKAVKTV